jgi:pentatricopeptide repeat protein
VMSLLSNAAPNERGHQIYSDLNSIQFTTLHHQQQQHFALKLIETSCQTKFVEAPKVQPYDLINFIKLVWKNNKDLITTPVLESLVSSICSTVPTPPRKNDILFLWDLVKRIGHHHQPAGGILNARILNKLIQSFSVTGQEGEAALQVFNKFEVFQCVPNHDTYYFTLQALLSTECCSADMIEQAASICQKMLLLLPHDHDGGYSSSPQEEYIHLPPSRDEDIDDDFTAPKRFQNDLTFLGGIPRPHSYGCVCANVNSDDVKTMRQQLHHFVLKVIETSSQTKLTETPKVSPHNLIHFMNWAWRSRNTYKHLITTPVLESLVSAICRGSIEDNIYLRKNDIYFLWELLKHIGHYQTDLLNTQILNQLLHSLAFMLDQGKIALEVFHKFEAFQCVPNRDTYTFTLKALLATRCITDMTYQAASICQKMLLHPETILPDDGYIIGHLLSLFSQENMIKEAYALYMAANEKRKTNPNWSLKLKMLLPLNMIKILCLKKETVHLALEMLNDIPEVDAWEEWLKQTLFMHVARALCGFKDLEAAKKLILKMIADNQRPSIYVINIIITAYVKDGEIGQVLEMVRLLESIGVYICDPHMFGFTHSKGLLHIRKILDKCKKEDCKLIVALLYHTLIAGYCRLQKFDDALKSLTRMKDFGFSHINLDEYQRLIHSLSLTAMDRKMAREQLEEMEPMDRKMAEKQLSKIAAMDLRMREEKLEGMYLIIKELF